MKYNNLQQLMILVILLGQILPPGVCFGYDFSIKDGHDTLAPNLNISHKALKAIFKDIPLGISQAAIFMDFPAQEYFIKSRDSDEVFKIQIEQATERDLDIWFKKQRHFKRKRWNRTIKFLTQYKTKEQIVFIKATYKGEIIGLSISDEELLIQSGVPLAPVLYGRIVEVDKDWKLHGIGKQLLAASLSVKPNLAQWSMLDFSSTDSVRFLGSLEGNTIAGRDAFIYNYLSKARVKELLRKDEKRQADLKQLYITQEARPKSLPEQINALEAEIKRLLEESKGKLTKQIRQLKDKLYLTDLKSKTAEFQTLCNDRELDASRDGVVSQGIRYLRISHKDLYSRDIEIPKDETIVLGSTSYSYCRAGVVTWTKDGKRFMYILHDAWHNLYRYINHKVKDLKEENAQDIKIVIHGSFDELTDRRTLNPLFMNIQSTFYFKDHEKGQKTAIALLKLHLADKLKISLDNIALDIKEDDKTRDIDITTVVATKHGVAIHYIKDDSKDRFVLWGDESLSLRDNRGRIMPSDAEIRNNLKKYNVLTKYFLGVRMEDIKRDWVYSKTLINQSI